MDSSDIPRLVYLLMLGGVLVFWFLVQNRQSLGKKVQQAMAWVFIFIGVIAVVGLWEDIRQTVRPMQGAVTAQGTIEVPRSPDGHYYMTLAVNGQPVNFLVDTGATDIVLRRQDAQAAGINLNDLTFYGRAMTANGEVRTAPVRLDSLSFGPIEDRNVRAWVNDGDMEQSLLGMAYLQRWSRMEFQGGSLVLTR